MAKSQWKTLPDGRLTPELERVGWRRGFAELLDFHPPRLSPATMSADERLALAFRRAEEALRAAAIKAIGHFGR